VKIVEMRAYKGRNIYSHQKVIRMVLDMQSLPDLPTKDLGNFNKLLIEYFPGLKDHFCSRGYKGGFLERLEEGTYLPHVIEHLAIEIQNCIGYAVSFGKARKIKDVKNHYAIIYAYESQPVGMSAGENAVEIANCLLNHADPNVKERLQNIKELDLRTSPGPSTKSILDAAQERGIPVISLGNGSIYQLGYGRYQKRIEATISDDTSCIAVDIACDKNLTNTILSEVGIPVPTGIVCHNMDDVERAVEILGYPLVLKPQMGNQGKGVFLNLRSKREVEEAYQIAKEIDENVLVEKYIQGKDYRILVVGNEVVAVAERIPPHIVGDGVHTIQELIDEINQDTNRGEDHEKPLTRIKVDAITLSLLRRQGLGLENIPAKKQVVYLRENGNLSTGGIAIDCTEKIHPLNCEMAIRAARTIGLEIAGIDVICPDISLPIKEGTGAIIEVNAAPGIRMHLYPSKGKPRNVGKNIIDMLFPPGSKFSIPIVSVTGTNGKTTTTRLIAHILRVSGFNVGMTTTGGVYLNEKCVLKGDTTGPDSAKIVLMDKSVDAAVLETARGGIIRAGLGYDLSDIGIITNISEDHLGLDGIYSKEDLFHVKSLVVEAVKSNGYAVLNADDPVIVQGAKGIRANIIYFSKHEGNLVIHKHVAQGGIAVFLKGNYITISTGDGLLQVADIHQIPATYGGRLIHNVENCLAAVAGCYGLKIPIPIIKKGLMNFYSDELQNPGRFNVYNIKDFRVVVDYAHNMEGYKNVIHALHQMGASRLVGIIGVPGDRDDQSIYKIGQLAGRSFGYIYIKEDEDLRGRKPGEVSRILQRGALAGGASLDQIEIILSETHALKKAMKQARPGDLITIFYEHLEPVLEIIRQEMEQSDAKGSEQAVISEISVGP